MTYRIEIVPSAVSDIEEAYLWIARDASTNAHRWRQGLYRAIASLDTLPFRYALAPEDDAVDFELRQHIYKSHRVLYTVIEDTVYVVHVRHGAREFLKEHEIRRPP